MRCEQCNVELDEDGFCPRCGRRYIGLSEDLIPMDGYRLGKKDKAKYNSPKHPKYFDEMDLYEFNFQLGEYVRRYKKEDRLNDEYVETITRRSGEIIHQSKEKLSLHIQHGCAKKKDKK